MQLADLHRKYAQPFVNHVETSQVGAQADATLSQRITAYDYAANDATFLGKRKRAIEVTWGYWRLDVWIGLTVLAHCFFYVVAEGHCRSCSGQRDCFAELGRGASSGREQRGCYFGAQAGDRHRTKRGYRTRMVERLLLSPGGCLPVFYAPM